MGHKKGLLRGAKFNGGAPPLCAIPAVEPPGPRTPPRSHWASSTGSGPPAESIWIPLISGGSKMQVHDAQLRSGIGIASKLHVFVEVRFRFRENVVIAGHPHIQRGKQENAHDQIGDETSHNHDGKRPLRIRADSVRHCRRQ